MASALVTLGGGIVIGYMARDRQLSENEPLIDETARRNIEAFGSALGSASHDLGRVAIASIAFLAGEFPLQLMKIIGDTFSTVFEWGLVKPIEVVVDSVSSGMEAIAHTISLMVLGFVFFPLFFPVMIMLPVFFPLLIPIVMMNEIFKEVMRPYRLY